MGLSELPGLLFAPIKVTTA